MATRMAVQMAEKALNTGGGLSGLTTGLETVNAKTGGLHHSDLIILAGRPGMGKTALATNIAFNTARRYRAGHGGRDRAREIGGRARSPSSASKCRPTSSPPVSSPSNPGSAPRALRMGKISQQDFRNLARAAAELETLPLYIDDTPGLTIAALRTRARRLKRQRGIGLVVVDYLQLLQGTGRNGTDNRVQEISEISRGLKTLAKELGVPVLALSQLSRAVEQREDKRPQLSDLRESGSIEQDADIVLFIYREEYYVAAHEPKRPIEGDDAKIFESPRAVAARHGAGLRPGRIDRRQAAPRRHRQGQAEVRGQDHPLLRPCRRGLSARGAGLTGDFPVSIIAAAARAF